MTDFSHLDALQARQHNEQSRLHKAEADIKTAKGNSIKILQNEINYRKREITSCEKEIAAEYKFLGIEPAQSIDDISIEDLLKELAA